MCAVLGDDSRWGMRMELYLTMLYVTREQELAIKDMFHTMGWPFSKPEMSSITDRVGPIAGLEKPIKHTKHQIEIRSCKDLPSPTGSTESSPWQHSVALETRIIEQNKVAQPNCAIETRECAGKYSIHTSEHRDTDDETESSGKFDHSLHSHLMQSPKVDHELVSGFFPRTDCNNPDAGAIDSEIEADYPPQQIRVKLEPHYYDEDVHVDRTVSLANEHVQRSTALVETVQQGRELEDSTERRAPVCDRVSGLEETGSVVDGGINIYELAGGVGQSVPQTDVKHKLEPEDQSSKRLTGIMPLEICCDICGRGFRSKYGLTRHMREHTGDLFKCGICNKGYKERFLLTDHLATHSESGVQKHQCNECYKRFTNKSNYVKHMRLHSMERRYWCVICQLQFYSKGRLSKHIQCNH